MIDKKNVEHIAQLARIEINDKEKEFLGSQLSKIIEYVDKLREVDVANVSPMRGPFLKDNMLREDQVSVFENREAILKNAPEVGGDFFKIPRVIE